MAGYSGTALPQKLGIKEGHAVLTLNAPAAFAKTLGKLPAGLTISDSARAKGPFDVIVCFVEKPGDVATRIEALMPKMAPACGLWMGWKKGQRGPDALNENLVRDAALAAGLVDNKVCAIDETWSGLRLVIRVKDRK